MDNFGDKFIAVGVFFLLLGITSFFLRPVYMSCDSQKDNCSIYRVPGFAQNIRYSDIKGCTCGSYNETYIPSSEHRKARNLRRIGAYGYEKKSTTVKREFPSLYFDEYTVDKYKDVDLTQVNGFTCDDIDKLCSDIMSKRTFKFKSNKYLHNTFDYWFLFILFGIFAIFFGKNLE